MTDLCSREQALYHRGLKDGALYVQRLAQFQGLIEFQKKSQEFIDGAEDTEIRLAVEVTRTSNVPVDQL